MKNTAIFKQQYAPYQSYCVAGFDSIMNTGACFLGCVHGEYGVLKAVVTESVTAHDQWRVVNLQSEDHFDSVAVLGAVDDVEASSLALMHYGHLFDSANVHVDTMETSVYGLKRHLDCAYYHDKPRLIQPWQLNELQDVATAEKPMWDNMSLKSHSGQLSTLLFDMQSHDDHNGLLNSFDGLASYLEQIGSIEQAFDSIIVDYQHLEYFMGLLHKAMNNASKGGVHVENIEISKPFKRKGVAQVAVSYLMKDGQTITILFHNPDSTPSKLAQSDTLISWKTLLNRRDVTGVVQPNQGEGLSMPVLAGRIMQLVNKNSARFVRTQAKKQQVEKELNETQARLQDKKLKLDQLNADIESVKKQLDEVQANTNQVLEEKKAKDRESSKVLTAWNSQQAEQDFQGYIGDLAEDERPSAGAKRYFSAKLQDLIVQTKVGDVRISSKSRGKIFDRIRPMKLLAIPYIPEVLLRGVVGQLEPLSKVRKDGITGFYQFDKVVDTAQFKIHITLKVGAGQQGQLLYYMGTSKITNPRQSVGSDALSITEGLPQREVTHLDSIQANYVDEVNGFDSASSDDGVNIEITQIIDKTTGKKLTESEAEQLLLARSKPVDDTPIVIQGDEFGEFPDTPEGKKALLKVAKQKLMDMRGHPVYCPALQSMVDISREGVSKITSFSADTRKLKIIPVIPNLIATASNLVTKESYLESEKLKGLIAYHYMQSKIELDNKFLNVKFVIKEKIGGHFQYDYTIEDEISHFDNILGKENASIKEAFSATNYKSGDQLGSHLLASSQPSVPTHTHNIQINDNVVKMVKDNEFGCIDEVKKIPSFDGILSATATCDRGVVNTSPDLPVSCVANLEISLENKQNNVNEFDSVDSDASNNDEYVLNLFIEGEDYVVNTDRSTIPTVTDKSNDDDVEYLQDILDGKIDFSDHQQTDDMVAKLEEIHGRLTPESQTLFEKVADAFATYAISLEVPGHD
ncbi:defense against restriction DarA-related protein [Acinetobacter boissieri]|uniref:Defence against restriction A N-terminal domain-containing protein n=1 Tax=Acinetobacter boissieri TaxID=1219383 RepID=A0A1G6GYP6_9GAMM|nr:hypothetical protein [Acinetobacter boissieri]SDB87003.1 hypothetical protein SAMN05421733_10328 [Acinetobacter boissieri]